MYYCNRLLLSIFVHNNAHTLTLTIALMPIIWLSKHTNTRTIIHMNSHTHTHTHMYMFLCAVFWFALNVEMVVNAALDDTII